MSDPARTSTCKVAYLKQEHADDDAAIPGATATIDVPGMLTGFTLYDVRRLKL